MKYKLLSIALFAILVVVGCSNSSNAGQNKTQYFVDSFPEIYIFCDNQKGVEYISQGYSQASTLTVRLNDDGSVSKCDKN